MLFKIFSEIFAIALTLLVFALIFIAKNQNKNH